jgi:hypothetical protein
MEPTTTLEPTTQDDSILWATDTDDVADDANVADDADVAGDADDAVVLAENPGSKKAEASAASTTLVVGVGKFYNNRCHSPSPPLPGLWCGLLFTFNHTTFPLQFSEHLPSLYSLWLRRLRSARSTETPPPLSKRRLNLIRLSDLIFPFFLSLFLE